MQELEALTYAHLCAKERFPDGIDLIITTSKLREGINIHDESLKFMITELWDSVSLVQAQGRARLGLKYLYIVEERMGKRAPFKAKLWEESKLNMAFYNHVLQKMPQNDAGNVVRDAFVQNIEQTHENLMHFDEHSGQFTMNDMQYYEYLMSK